MLKNFFTNIYLWTNINKGDKMKSLYYKLALKIKFLNPIAIGALIGALIGFLFGITLIII